MSTNVKRQTPALAKVKATSKWSIWNLSPLTSKKCGIKLSSSRIHISPLRFISVVAPSDCKNLATEPDRMCKPCHDKTEQSNCGGSAHQMATNQKRNEKKPGGATGLLAAQGGPPSQKKLQPPQADETPPRALLELVREPALRAPRHRGSRGRRRPQSFPQISALFASGQAPCAVT